jgi:hypothetical protein
LIDGWKKVMATLGKGCHEGFYAFQIFGKDILFAKTILTLPAGTPKPPPHNAAAAILMLHGLGSAI